MRVFLHLKDKPSDSWLNQELHWERIPSKGDTFALDATEPIYKVVCIVYPMFDDKEWDVEIYAIKTTLEKEVL